jgi:hypothetical protein
MKRIIPVLLIFILLSSGCTQTEQLEKEGDEEENQENLTSPEETGGIEPLQVGTGEGWYCGSFKVNGSLVGYDQISPVKEAAKQAGFSFIGVVINLSEDDADPLMSACEEANEINFIIIPSQVVGNCEGWLVGIGTREKIEPEQSLEGMIDQIHEQGGVAYITHPMQEKNCSEWKRWDIPGWDGLAVVSPMTQTRQDDMEALERWHTMLNNGRIKYAFGETDTKPFTSIYGLRNILDSSYQCVYIEGNFSEVSIKEALRSGRFYVTNGPVLNFEVNGYGPGEVFNASYGEEVNLSLDVSSLSAFNRIRIIKNGIVIQEIGKSLNRYSINLTSTIARDTWFSADVWGADYTPQYHDFIHAISNPIWIDVKDSEPILTY